MYCMRFSSSAGDNWLCSCTGERVTRLKCRYHPLNAGDLASLLGRVTLNITVWYYSYNYWCFIKWNDKNEFSEWDEILVCDIFCRQWKNSYMKRLKMLLLQKVSPYLYLYLYLQGSMHLPRTLALTPAFMLAQCTSPGEGMCSVAWPSAHPQGRGCVVLHGSVHIPRGGDV